MKVLIDLIEDMRTVVDHDPTFSLTALRLTENEQGEFSPAGQGNICQYTLDDLQKKLYFFLGKEAGLDIGVLFNTLNSLANETMMYEVCVSYARADQRIDQPLIGFGESLQEKRYFLFISDQ